MGSVTTIDKRELKEISRRSTTVAMGYNPATVDECVDLYNNASEIASVAKQAIKDGLQGKALLEAKKFICGDDWNKKHVQNNGWIGFLQKLSLLQKNGQPSVQVYRLLDFAGYKEAEQNLIQEGIDVETIDTASHYREVKKLTDVNTPEAVATIYTQAVEANNGAKPSTAREVKDVVSKSLKKVNSYDYFMKNIAECQEKLLPAPMAVSNDTLRIISSVDIDVWKPLYRKLAKIVHPDKGGTDDEMSLLSSLNSIITLVSTINKDKQFNSDVRALYEMWCKENDYEAYSYIEIEDDKS